jgi:hypothetical protein
MLLRALGILVLSTGLAAAQAPVERASRGSTREVRADRTRLAAQTPAPRASRTDRASRNPNREVQADRTRDTAQVPAERGSSPAERASRSLERDMRGDRFRDAANDARGSDRPTRPEVQQFEPQRRSLQPDVGRPEQQGFISPRDSQGTAGVGTNAQR